MRSEQASTLREDENAVAVRMKGANSELAISLVRERVQFQTRNVRILIIPEPNLGAHREAIIRSRAASRGAA